MIFKITLNSNINSVGDVFFTIPSKYELIKAEKIVYDLCNERIVRLYNDNSVEFKTQIVNLLNNELDKMVATETAYHFLILKEIADLSTEKGYPIITLGDLSGSIISYLLGITKYDCFSTNLKNYAPKIIWGTEENTKTPDFTIGIAPQIRSLINERLDSKYGSISCDNKTYKQISLDDVKTCENLGKLLKKFGSHPDNCEFDDTIYLRVVENIVDDYLNLTRETKECVDYTSFSKELLQKNTWNFDSALRLYAYTNGAFNHTKSTSVLNDSNFFVTREEFFKCLTQHNIPANIALDIVKKGVWSMGEKRKKYVEVLDNYNVPEHIKNYFSDVTHLCTYSSCVDRLLHNCYIAWYQEKHPTEF